MPLQPIVPALILATTMSIMAMVWSVGAGARSSSLWAALAFAAVVVIATFLVNRPAWASSPDMTMDLRRDRAIDTARRNAWMMSSVYAWGGLAILAIYTLTELWWWHSWQYGGAMLLVAAGLFLFAHIMGYRTSFLRSDGARNAGAWAAIAQATAAVGGLGFLVATGKLGSIKPDWPANHVFLAGGLALIAISVMSAATHFHAKSELAQG